MKIRRITASSMQKALRKVSEEMGADAVILSNRKITNGVEIVAADHYPNEDFAQTPASNTDAVSLNQRLNAKQKKPAKSATRKSQTVQRSALTAPSGAKAQPLVRDPNAIIKSTSLVPSDRRYSISSEKASTGQWDRQQQLQDALVAWKQSNPTPVDALDEPGWDREKTLTNPSLPYPGDGLDNSFATMKAELDQLQAMLIADAQGHHWTPEPSPQSDAVSPYSMTFTKPSWHQWSQYSPCNLVQAELWKRWQQVGLEDWLCFEICSDIQGFEALEASWLKTVRRLQRRIPIAKTRFIQEGGVLALLGPTGAGKTTTTCKLAVEKVLSQGPNSVALVTTDNYRIAAHGQLMTLGRILGICVKTLQAGEALADCLMALTEFESILIDTAGLTPSDPDLSLQMDLLQQSRSHFDALLALPSTSQGRSLRRLMQLYAPLQPSACVLTKLDEADAIGEVLSVVIEKQLPIAFVSCGQRVPDDLIQAKAYGILKEALQRVGLQVPTEQSTTEQSTTKQSTTKQSTTKQSTTEHVTGSFASVHTRVSTGDSAKEREPVDTETIESKACDQTCFLEENTLSQELNHVMLKEGQPIQQGFQFEDYPSSS